MKSMIAMLIEVYRRWQLFLQSYGLTLLILLASTAIVWIGASFGCDVIQRNAQSGFNAPKLVPSMSNYDGNHYRRIVDQGYQYDPARASNVAFFPGYPLVAWLMRRVTGLPTTTVLPLVSFAALFVAMLVFQSYSRDEHLENDESEARWSRIALCLWPTGLFLRAGYSESLFLLLILLALAGLRRNWPNWQVAVIIGAATGVRSVGVALLLPLVWKWWRESKTPLQLIGKGVFLGPIACWGLIAYIVYLHFQFNDPLAFAQTQRHWASRPPVGLLQNIFNLVTFEPIWSVYASESPALWTRQAQVSNPLFSIQFFNPIYFVACAGLVGYGAWKKWLTTSELLLSAGLLGIPYVMQSHRMLMLGHGRFTCVVFPMFIVIGRLLARAPAVVQSVVVALMAIQLFYWSAMFSSWHRVY